MAIDELVKTSRADKCKLLYLQNGMLPLSGYKHTSDTTHIRNNIRLSGPRATVGDKVFGCAVSVCISAGLYGLSVETHHILDQYAWVAPAAVAVGLAYSACKK